VPTSRNQEKNINFAPAAAVMPYPQRHHRGAISTGAVAGEDNITAAGEL
jgi:hypothetical protein